MKRKLTKSEIKSRKEKTVSFIILFIVSIIWILPLVYMLDKHGESYLKQGNLIDEDSLYVAGDVFDKDLVFNKGAQLEYNIRIDSLDSSKATISFIKK